MTMTEIGTTATEKTVKKKWTWRKPKGKPKRPLSAYNIFFQEMRPIIMAHPAVSGFSDLAKVVAAHWKNLNPTMKRPYEEKARQDMVRYRMDLSIWEMNRTMEANSVTPPPPSEDDADPKSAALFPVSHSSNELSTNMDSNWAWNEMMLLSPVPTPEPIVRFVPPIQPDPPSSNMMIPVDPLEPLPVFYPRGTSRNFQWEADCARTLASLSSGLLFEPFDSTPEW
jgi:HMG (high mobility group) box